MKIWKSIGIFLSLSGIVGGVAVGAISGVWSFIDLGLLYGANQEVTEKVKKVSPSEAQYLYSRELAHRINVFADGTWTMLGFILAVQSLGVLVQLLQKTNKEN
ncbi:MAG: hypothetical protein N5P05_004327 (plasmid) [Chroococcopsis gigantea SAG 12.99]|jgi:hypothetical protein|nr:hypothetical protein [Chroococcopsis gigantea SAG 12.99]